MKAHEKHMKAAHEAMKKADHHHKKAHEAMMKESGRPDKKDDMKKMVEKKMKSKKDC